MMVGVDRALTAKELDALSSLDNIVRARQIDLG